jgi:hypothetical protein
MSVTMQSLTETLEKTLGYKLLSVLRTVAFLNLPRSGDDRFGHGFVALAKKGEKVTLHFFEHDVAAFFSTKTIDSKLSGEDYVIGIRNHVYESQNHAEEDGAQRATSRIFGTLPVSDIISGVHFGETDVRVSKKVNGKSARKSESEGCCSCKDCRDFCPRCDFGICSTLKNAMSCCTAKTCCRNNVKAEFEFTPFKAKSEKTLADYTTITEKVKVKQMVITRDPFSRSEGESDKTFEDAIGEEVVVKVVQNGIELFYVDHAKCTRELGVIVCDPNTSLGKIIEFSATLTESIHAIDRKALEFKYSRPTNFYGYAVDPMRDFQIGKRAGSRLLDGSGPSLGIINFTAEINVEISVPYKWIAMYLNMLASFAGFLAACLSLAGVEENDTLYFNIVIALYDIFQFVIRVMGFNNERNTNSTFRRDIILGLAALIFAIVSLEYIDVGESDSERRLNEYEPAPSPTRAPPDDDDDDGMIEIDSDAASQAALAMTFIQAILCMLGSAVAMYDNQRRNNKS